MRKKATFYLPFALAMFLLTFGQGWSQPCATPTNVMATPTMVCPGSPSQLNAISTGNNIAWYDAATSGNLVGTAGSGINFAVTPVANTTYYAEAVGSGGNGSQSFAYTGSLQSFTVPSGVTSVNVTASGAQGGLSGGLGATITGTFTVTSGEVLSVMVGGQGTSYSNGNGGGGGGSFVWQNIGTVLMVAAAGGGGTSNNSNSSVGGPGSATATPTNSINGSGNGTGGSGGNGGSGGQAANNGAGYPAGGGGGAGWSSDGTLGAHQYGATGGTMPLSGGAGGTGFNPCGSVNIVGGFGGGGGGGGCSGASGGGGGYNGGGGGNCWNGSTWGSGGGGGSFNGGTSQTNTGGVRSGDGVVTITWTGTTCTPSTPRIPVTVILDSLAPTASCQAATVSLDQSGNGGLLASDVDNGSSDNCSVSTMSLSQTVFTCADAGIDTLVLTVTDANGNSSTCSAIVTVNGFPMTSSSYADTTTCGYNVSCFAGSDGLAHASANGGCPNYSYLWSNGQTSALATGLAAGTYTVTITDAAGATSTSTVTLSQPPQLLILLAITSSCAGEADGIIEITTTTGGNNCQGGYSYLWSNGSTSTTVTGLTPGIYDLTLTDGSGCSVVFNITVPAFPTPNPLFTQSGYTLTATQTWTTYQWLLNGSNIPGATSISYTATQSGSYSLMVTDGNGCTGVSDTTNITVVGIANAMGDWADLTLYPNPTRAEFRLQTAAPVGCEISVRIHDMYGRMVFGQALPDLSHEAAFDVKALAAGTYMVEVTSVDGHHKIFRLLIE